MSKQCLDLHQMQHLQELGLELDYNTMLSWIVDERGKDNPLLCISSEAVDYVDFSHYCLPAYTLQDVLDALPKNVSSNGKSYYLNVDLCVGYVCYDRRREDDLLVGVSFAKTGCFINAAYSLLCWAIENKFVETNKNK